MRLALVALIFLAAVPACATPLKARIPHHAVGAKRLVAMPVMVEAYELDVHEKVIPQPEIGDRVRANIGASVYRLVTDNGGRAEALANGADADPLLDQFWRWGNEATFEIARQAGGKADFGKRSVGAWSFPAELAGVRERLDANQALFVVVRDMWLTLAHHDRVNTSLAANVLNTHDWLRVAVACVADLREQRMIWCDSRVDKWDALTDPDTARFAVHDLLSNLYRSGADF